MPTSWSSSAKWQAARWPGSTSINGGFCVLQTSWANRQRGWKAQPVGGLTQREREVAALIARGKTNREIADALVLGERTVQTHVGHILDKLGFSSRTQIAVWATDRGLPNDA